MIIALNMQTSELQLFTPEIPLKDIIPPFPTKEDRQVHLGESPQGSLENAIARIFPSSQEENDIQKARRMLGEIVQDVPDADLKVFVTEAQYLISYWFDCFEKSIFDGSTLKQILKEG